MKYNISIQLCLVLVSAALSQTPNQLSEVERCQGFTSLFDGNIATFRNQFVNYIRGQDNNTNLEATWSLDATTQAVTITNNNTADIRSKTKYRDFDLRMVYKNTGNQGFYYRFSTVAPSAYESGVELAIDNNATPAEGPKSSAGAAYDMWAPSSYTYKAYNTAEASWNELRVVVKKDSVEHWMNGTKVVGFRYHSTAWWSAYENSKWKGVATYSMKVAGDRGGGYIDEGYIGFQGSHGGKWYIRNLRIVSDTAKVKMGPVVTTCTPVSIGSEAGRRTFVSTAERLNGSLRIRFTEMAARKVTVSGLDGRVIPLVTRIEDRGEAVVLSGWKQSGIYLLRTTGADHSVHHEKIFLH